MSLNPAPPALQAASPSVSWRRNQFAVTAASFIGYTGFTLVMPFLPIFISQLGVTEVGEVAVWSGLCLGVTPAVTALLSPAWGRVADRFGRKLMVERALISFVVIMAAMAFVRRPWQIFALRAVQGFFAGYGSLTLAMATESAPRERMAQAIGMVQTAQRLGPALGPVIGGLVAGLVGLRRSFLVAAAIYGVAFVLVLVMYRERPAREREAGASAERGRLGAVVRLPNFLVLMGVLFGIQFADRSFGPILPLYVVAIGVRPDRAALITGVLFSTLACSAAIGHHFCGRLLKRVTARRIIASGAALAATAVAVIALVPFVGGLGLAFAVFGAAVGAAMTAAYTAGGSVVPEGVHGTAFGVLSSSALVGLALSPVVSGLLWNVNIRSVFAFDIIVLIAVAAGVRRLMVDPGAATVAPATEDV
ncbi:MAG: MFS transporter [Planctomycetes bacterium]|nr:MFS transporter [Planctomycetota bacterium]